jgi:hypothetical protein
MTLACLDASSQPSLMDRPGTGRRRRQLHLGECDFAAYEPSAGVSPCVMATWSRAPGRPSWQTFIGRMLVCVSLVLVVWVLWYVVLGQSDS